VERVGVTRATPNQGLTEARTDLMIVDRNTEVTTTSSSVWKKPYWSREWMAGWDSDERKACGHCPFLIAKINKGCQSG
jgi:hypothetical protein